MMFCSRYGSALLLALGMLSAHVADAYYYGGYRYYGGPAVVRRTVVVRGRRGRWGRRLAQVDDDDFDALAFLAESPATSPSMAPAASVAEEEDDATECDTILDIVETRPEFSSLAAALANTSTGQISPGFGQPSGRRSTLRLWPWPLCSVCLRCAASALKYSSYSPSMLPSISEP